MTLNITNLNRLISHLEGLPEERFNMGFVFEEHPCGTVGCIIGHSYDVFADDLTEIRGPRSALGLDEPDYDDLTMPVGWSNDKRGDNQYPLYRAIRTLKHMRAEFLRTGQVVVDWDAPEPAARKDWVAPQAVERVLPAEITKLLTPSLRVEVL
jgi:hypothetical protein